VFRAFAQICLIGFNSHVALIFSLRPATKADYYLTHETLLGEIHNFDDVPQLQFAETLARFSFPLRIQ